MTKSRLQLTWYNKDKALIPTEKGKYGYTWVDPSDPRYCETHTLVLDEYINGYQTPKTDKYIYSPQADITPQNDNLLILGESGDVLETLTRVPELVSKYVGKIKQVYIDPPFNTEQTFESYEDNLEHSIWLTMMRDRLLHIKKLLAPEGSIWVHLDNAEVHRMRLLLDEIFGPENFVIDMHWEKKYGASNNSHSIASMTDTILVYQKSSKFAPNRLPRTAAMDARYLNPDNDPRGRWKVGDATARHNIIKTQHPGVYGFQNPFTGEMQYPSSGANWYFHRDKIKDFLNFWGEYIDGDIDDEEIKQRHKIEGNDVELRDDVRPLILKEWSEEIGQKNIERYNNCALPQFTPTPVGGAILKVYLDEVSGRVPVNLLPHEEVGHNDLAKKEIQALFPDVKAFSTPKPERLLERIIHIGSNPGDIVLDCFAGSGTTAAVAQKMGRRWVTCELLAYNYYSFVKPRLEMVVRDLDKGGITITKGERIPAEGVELPDSISVEDAAVFNKVLSKVLSENSDLGNLAKKDEIIKQLKKQTKTTKTKDTVNWRGGGGFQTAHLSPACYDYDCELDCVTLTPDATGDILIKSVAANLGFRMIKDNKENVFDARRGKTVLKVIEGVVNESIIDWLIPQLSLSETLVIAALSVPDGMREYLRKQNRGSKIVSIPYDLFKYQKQ